MNKLNTTPEVKIEILSKLKKEILAKQDERKDLMVEYIMIKRKIQSLDQHIGNKQRELLENIP